MKTKTRNLSRYLVALFTLILAQSTLGTKADLVEAKNLGQNGYKKYSDGFMLQWGYVAISGSNKIVYFPQSFADANYSIVANFFIEETYNGTAYCLQIKYRGTSYFRATSTQNTTDADRGLTERPYFYIAIGRWK